MPEEIITSAAWRIILSVTYPVPVRRAAMGLTKRQAGSQTPCHSFARTFLPRHFTKATRAAVVAASTPLLDIDSAGCTAYQSVEGLLCPTTKFTDFVGFPPANSADERSKMPTQKMRCPCAAGAGIRIPTTRTTTNIERTVLFGLTFTFSGSGRI